MKTSTSTTTSATSAAPTWEQIGGRLPDPALSGVSSSAGSSRQSYDRGSLTRPPALATVGGRCLVFTNMEEVSSSSAQRSTLPFKEVRWRRCSSLERIQILCDVAKGSSIEEQSPSPVTRPPSDGICLDRSDHETTRVYSMWTTIWPWDP